MAAVLRRRSLNRGSPSTIVSAFLDSLLTDQGMILRRTSSGVEGYLANTNNTLLGGNGSGVASRDADFVRSMINAFDGTYTPTLNNTTNVAASTATLCMYSRVDDFVTVMGYCEIDPTTAAGTATVLGMSIPIASNFTNSLQLAGIAISYATAQMAHIGADSTNDRARWDFLASSNLNTGWRFVFGYRVL